MVIVSPPSSAILYLENVSDTHPAEIKLESLFNGLEQLCLLNNMNILGLDNVSERTFSLNPPVEHHQLFEVPQEWLQVKTFLLDYDQPLPPIIVVAGPRKVGKSTFARFLANSLLDRYERVAFIDSDPGQTEFMPPGFLTLSIIKSPLLGPPFSHVGMGIYSHYLGSTGADANPLHFFNCAQSLIEEYEKLCERGQRLPLIVNTMGWITGLGLLLLQAVTQTLHPTHFFAICNGESLDDGHANLPNFVRTTLYEPVRDLGRIKPRFSPYQPNDRVFVKILKAVEAAGKETNFSFITPKERREIMWKAYFHRREPCSDFFYFNNPLTHFEPFRVSWKRIVLLLIPRRERIDLHQILAILPGCIVGLAGELENNMLCTNVRGARVRVASSSDPPPICNAAALVRAVDPSNQTLEILTPLSLESITRQKLYTLVLNPEFSIPSTLFVNESGTFFGGPYMSSTSTYGGSLVSHGRKVRVNIQRRWQRI